MITKLLAKYLGPVVLVLGALIILVALGVYGLHTIDTMIERAATGARSERDHYWRGQVDAMRAQAQAEINRSLKETMAAQNAARDEIASLEARAQQLEKENAALPDGGAGGLGRDRVRLLNKR